MKRTSRRWPAAALLGAVAVVMALAVATRGPVSVARARSAQPPTALFGPSAVWRPGADAIRALHACPRITFSCVRQVMDQDGAGNDAIAFYHLTGWFLYAIDADDGALTVQRGTVFNPWRANENEQPVLLNGEPAVIFPEQSALLSNFAGSASRDPAFVSLKAAYPDALFWGPGPAPERAGDSPDGGPEFVYDYRLLDGCHACAVLGWARFGFEFSPDGTAQGVAYLGITLNDVPTDPFAPSTLTGANSFDPFLEPAVD